MEKRCVLECVVYLKGTFTNIHNEEFTASISGSLDVKIPENNVELSKIIINKECTEFAYELIKQFRKNYSTKLIKFVGTFDVKTNCYIWNENDVPIIWDYKNKYNTILIVCDQLINFKNIPQHILDIMPGYQSFKKIGIQFNNIYNNRQDCSPSRASFASSQININISDNIDQVWQYDYNPQLNTSFDTIGKSMKRNGFETVWYGKNHFIASIATDVNEIPAFNTNSRGCLKEYGYDIYNTFGDTYYYANEGMFADNTIFELKVNDSNENVDFVDATGKYIGAIPYLKSQIDKQRPFHLELHLENPHDTQHFWQNFAEKPTKPQVQFWAPYLDEQIKLLQEKYPDRGIYNPYKFSELFQDAYIQNPNLVKNYFEDTFTAYMNNKDSLPFLSSFETDYVSDPSSRNSQFAFYTGFINSLVTDTTFPENKDDLMSWKNLINNYYGLLLEIDNYIFKLYNLLENNNMLDKVSVMIISDHGDMISSHGMKQKGLPFENACNVSCLVYSPYINASLRGSESNVLGSLLDVAPTLETLANISNENKSKFFLGKSLLEKSLNGLTVRNDNIPVMNVYNAWMTYLTYFYYKGWLIDNFKNNTILKDFNPSNFTKYLAFFTMIVTNINNKKYKLARYFNLQELFLYNFVFNPALSTLNITADMLITNVSGDITTIVLLNAAVYNYNNIVNNYFATNTWNFLHFLDYLTEQTSKQDTVELMCFYSSITNIVRSNVGFVFETPGYYNNTFPIGNNFIEYYDDPDHNYYFFMYDLYDDPNETVNLLDKGYPERQTPEIIATAGLLNDALNLELEKNKIVFFDFIIPDKIFNAIALNLGIHNGIIDKSNYISYASCFRLAKADGDKRTQSYYREAVSILQKKP
jgi:arylsulfatase A-like enzyme